MRRWRTDRLGIERYEDPIPPPGRTGDQTDVAATTVRLLHNPAV